ncbi:MAG: peptidoglycan recognition family protein [Planctomycetota bacterium]
MEDPNRPQAAPTNFHARRRLLRAAGVTSLAALAGSALTGCVLSSSAARARAGHTQPIYPPNYRQVPPPHLAPPARPVAAAPAQAPAAAVAQPLRLHVIPRAAWTRASVGSNINPLNGVNRITVHHAGGQAFWATDARSTYKTLESIRGGHRSNGWADIGYHFIVDRDGRVLEGRNLRYQGAHVSENNEHNVGVMVLGNFNEQSPSRRQLTALNATLNALAAAYQVPVHRVYTHRELGKTACPGRNLQAHMDRIRRTASMARG